MVGMVVVVVHVVARHPSLPLFSTPSPPDRQPAQTSRFVSDLWSDSALNGNSDSLDDSPEDVWLGAGGVAIRQLLFEA